MHRQVEAELAEQKAEYARLEEEARQREKQLQQAIEEGAVADMGPRGDDDEEDHMPRVNAEEQVKLLMRAEKAERRMAALEEEMQEMARANGREVAGLKMRLAEAQAQSKGGFGSAANFMLGELTPSGTVSDVPVLDGAGGGPPPLGSSRRSTPPANTRLGPLAAPPSGSGAGTPSPPPPPVGVS